MNKKYYEKMNFYYIVLILLILSITTTACSPILLGGSIITTAKIANDRRTAGTQLEDIGILIKIKKKIFIHQKKNRIKFTVYNRQVLIIGEVDSENTKQNITRIVSSTDGVLSVKNYLKIRSPLDVKYRIQDKLILSKIRLILLKTKNISSNSISITVDYGSVFLMGLVTQKEGNTISDIASKINGVNKVIKNFEYLDK